MVLKLLICQLKVACLVLYVNHFPPHMNYKVLAIKVWDQKNRNVWHFWQLCGDLPDKKGGMRNILTNIFRYLMRKWVRGGTTGKTWEYSWAVWGNLPASNLQGNDKLRQLIRLSGIFHRFVLNCSKAFLHKTVLCNERKGRGWGGVGFWYWYSIECQYPIISILIFSKFLSIFYRYRYFQ